MEMQPSYETPTLPYSAKVEAAVIGSLFIDPALMDTMADVEPGDFWLESHAKLYSIMCDLWDRGEMLDFVIVNDEIRRQGIDDLIPPGNVSDIVANVPTSLYMDHYIARLKRYSHLRKYVRMAQKLVEQAYDNPDLDELYAWLQEELQTINIGLRHDDALMGWHESFTLYDAILLEREEQAAAGTVLEDWSWPWSSWNRFIMQPEPGMLTTIAAGDGMGKTAYAENIAEHWAKRGHKVLFVHFELNRKLMLDRRAARNFGIGVAELRSGKLTDIQHARMQLEADKMMGWSGNITYLHSPGWSMEQVIREAKKLHELGRCDAVIVDYLEKAEMSPSQRKRFRDDSFRREANDVELLKNFAEISEVRIVQLSQLNKIGKATGFKALDRTGVRGAGEKSEKSNIVLLIHRQRVEDGETDTQGNQLVEPGGYSREVKVRVDKQTMGATGSLRQYFKGETFQIFDWEK